MNKNRIVGLWSGHDCSYVVLENGKPLIHYEYERHLRQKEPPGDSAKLYFDTFGHNDDVKYFATCHPVHKLEDYEESWQKIKETKVPIIRVGHHCAHAANAFFSSNINEALIMTIDGGEWLKNGGEFSHLEEVPDQMWDMLEKMRGK